MVILFITSGLEPGKDGVGDYTRLLAAECIRQNHSCYLMALNDLQISEVVESVESVEGISIPTLRLPSRLSWQERVELAADFRDRHPVDWISLQFVCYGFNPKGMVRNMARYFEPIVASHPLHVMFHETWIGVGRRPSIKDRLIGQIQRHYISELFRQLKPRLATSSNPFYVSLLQGIGISAIETPLFSNIPVSPADRDLLIHPALMKAGICDDKGLHPDRWLGLFFGALYTEWKAEPLLGLLVSAKKKTGKSACIISAGRMGEAGRLCWEELRTTYGHLIDFIALGECTPRQISALMHVVDFGLASTSWHLLGKSSSVTTMLDHGLPVIVTNYDYQPATAVARPDDPLLHRGDASLEAKLWAGLPRRPARHRIGDAVENLIGYLKKLTPLK